MAPLSLPKGDTVEPVSVVADGPNDVWATGTPSAGNLPRPGLVLVHWNGKVFTQVKVAYPADGPGYLTGDGSGGFWLTGTEYAHTTTYLGFFMYHYSGGRWTRVKVPNQPKNMTQVSSMAWIPGTRSVWAAGFEMPTAPGATQTRGLILKYGP